MEAFVFLAVIIGVPLVLYIAVVAAGSAVAKPIMRDQRDRQIEKDLRVEVADADARQRAARKLLKERGH